MADPISVEAGLREALAKIASLAHISGGQWAMEFARAALANDAQSVPARYWHKKRGTVYDMIGTAELQAEQPQCEHAQLAVYRGDDGKLWARNTGEFHDGRFEQVSTHPEAVSQVGEKG